MVIACGPTGMLKAVAKMSRKYNIDSFVATEERMACGIGACYGCTIPIEVDGNVKMLRVCKEGPVFKGSAFLGGIENA